MSKIYTPIPEPSVDPEALLQTVKTLKAVVDILTAEKNEVGSLNQTFVQRTTPKATKIGDNWVKPAVLKGETNIFSTWDGTRWLKII